MRADARARPDRRTGMPEHASRSPRADAVPRRAVELRGIDADADAAGLRIGEPRRLQVKLRCSRLEARQRIAAAARAYGVRVGSWHSTSASGCAPWRRPRLTPAKEAWNRASPVPRSGPSDRAHWPASATRPRPRRSPRPRRRSETPLAGDEDAGLAGGAEVGLEPALLHLALEAKRRVHLADGAIGAHGQQALARPLLAGADAETPGSDGARRGAAGRAWLPPRAGRARIRQPLMQPAREIEAELERR